MKQAEISALVKRFIQYKLTLAFAESCTAGMLPSGLIEAQGASSVLLGSIVTYHPTAKRKLLGVSQQTLDIYTAESQQVTNEMVMGLHKKLGADVCVAVTGLCAAGGSETEEKPAGTLFFTFLYQNRAEEHRQEFEGNCQSVRQQAVDFVYHKLNDLLDRFPPDQEKMTD
ncbi:CinA family protein [Hymenobacter sp. BT635]|uniref:CinA family protein n=1 Tax=Hymenobacter nitidus TaxID=2880929 RepID=A0ABS8ABA4_9BACT|nr:CinA family protein [Hymenobacter nitidus]MCB2377688.1 CinA family protein [Hymenobacter nitidus]